MEDETVKTNLNIIKISLITVSYQTGLTYWYLLLLVVGAPREGVFFEGVFSN